MVFSGISVIVSIGTFFINVYIERNKMTIDAYRSIQDYLYMFYEYSKDEIENFVSTDSDAEEYKVLSTSLAEIEFFATGVRSHIYNKRITYKMAHGFLDGTIRSGIDHLISLKNKYPDRKGFYNNTMWLLRYMDKKSKIKRRRV